MFLKYVVSPEGTKLIEDSGLGERVREGIKDDKFPSDLFNDHIMDLDIKSDMQYFKEEGYLDSFPNEEVKENYKGKLNEMFRQISLGNRPEFVISRPSGEERTSLNWESFRAFAGVYSSTILDPDEIWDFGKFGFDSLFDFLGTMGAFVYNENDSFRRFKEGYVWESEHGGINWISEITGDHNGDFRFFRTNITSYPTINPFGEHSNFRKITDKDRTGLIGYHSVESRLLAILLKYIQQENIDSNLLGNKGEKILEEFEGIAHDFGLFADAGMGPEPINHFLPGWNLSIPLLNNQGIIEERSIDFIGTIGKDAYETYIDEERNLTFTYDENPKEEKRTPMLTLPKEEVDEFVRGLFVQAQKGLGRTSVKQLTDLVRYRFSKDFEEVLELFKGRRNQK